MSCKLECGNSIKLKKTNEKKKKKKNFFPLLLILGYFRLRKFLCSIKFITQFTHDYVTAVLSKVERDDLLHAVDYIEYHKSVVVLLSIPNCSNLQLSKWVSCSGLHFYVMYLFNVRSVLCFIFFSVHYLCWWSKMPEIGRSNFEDIMFFYFKVIDVKDSYYVYIKLL